MNRESTLALWEECQQSNDPRATWNAWAEKMLARKAKLEEAGEWAFEIDQGVTAQPLNAKTKRWHTLASLDFSGHAFSQPADFSGFIFPADVRFGLASDAEAGKPTRFDGDATFESAAFGGYAAFGGVTFAGPARFGRAVFTAPARFDDATFEGFAEFHNANFDHVAGFSRAMFKGTAEFGGARFDGAAIFHQAEFEQDGIFEAASFKGPANYDSAKFEAFADFVDVAFEDDAGFLHTTFGDTVRYSGTAFKGNAQLGSAAFEGDALFDGAMFAASAMFDSAEFQWDASFQQAMFKGETRFDSATFAGGAWFHDASFAQTASFRAVRSEGAFTLADAVFANVPDFVQAHFREAPCLDDVVIKPGGFSANLLRPLTSDVSARFRTLKRLAVQAHDHERQMAFFAGERRARRWHRERPWQPSYWFGLFYELLSNFGRSMLLPLAWWLLTTGMFAWIYLSRHFERAAAQGSAYAENSLDWIGRWAYSTFSALTGLFPIKGGHPVPALVCLDGRPDGSPWADAVYLAIKNALLIVGWQDRAHTRQIYSCLFGDGGHRSEPIFPAAVSYAAMAQTIASAVLIFLFVLAVRNHFKVN